jgi:hypothetical protein
MDQPIIIEASLPPKECHAHNKGHWRKKSGPIKEYRKLGHTMAYVALAGYPPPKWPRAMISLQFYFPDNIRRDLLNAAQGCKPIIDGIVDAGIMAGDHWQVLSVGRISCDIDKANPRVEITVEPLVD